MNNNLIKYVAYGIGGLAVLLFILYGFGLFDAFYSDEDLAKNPNAGAELMFDVQSLFFWLLFAVSFIVMLVFMFKEMFSGDSAKFTLIGIGALLVVMLLSYLLAGSDTFGLEDVTEGASKMVDVGIYTFYVMITAVIGLIIWSLVPKK